MNSNLVHIHSFVNRKQQHAFVTLCDSRYTKKETLQHGHALKLDITKSMDSRGLANNGFFPQPMAQALFCTLPSSRGYNMIVDLLQSSDLAAFLCCGEANTIRRTCKRLHQEPLLAKWVTPPAREAEFCQDIRDRAEKRRKSGDDFLEYSEYSLAGYSIDSDGHCQERETTYSFF